jgi:hypothetical protein
MEYHLQVFQLSNEPSKVFYVDHGKKSSDGPQEICKDNEAQAKAAI